MPPIEPPTTAYQAPMPSSSANSPSRATWSRIVSWSPRAGDGRDPIGHCDLGLRGAEPGVEVGEDVVDRLDPDGQAHEVRGDPGGLLLRSHELLVRRGRRMDGEAAHVTHVG